MTVVGGAQRHARRARRSVILKRLTQVGFVGYGLLHLALGWLCLQILLGRGAADDGQTGAFRTIAAQPLGRFVLIVTAIGLIAMAVWQLLLAAVGHQDEQGWKRAAERLASLSRVVIYAALAFTAWKVVRGTATPSARQQQDFTADLLRHGAGQAIVVVAGIAVVGLGIGLAVYGLLKKFVRHLRTGEMSPAVRTASVRLGQLGYLAKGFAYVVVGVLVALAGIRYEPSRSGGLDAALKTLPQQPFGPLLLAVVAAGLAAFGAYCFVQARYRDV
ncbi:vacuolar-type H+-ATPase subunit I/STV1 [Allocatelliglobosispora scoriae]|uniref:Vacuolar-type H+-ATPase subunit I/STV1 n=1 Tax=Allocatelliglobosispora scoriae TaxID=643052 RepID=A0A841BJE6_9ACTN|nr:DUF1206 domain-containing protein [Allocatelliglobosispora scoriae]MBB5866902.1 vacuolar-type H+-ATPase subunit I/STV1 [Allocatelliglobosispora scoriae]